jgi:hypothetical protein
MRLYTVSSLDTWTMMKGPKGTSVPRLGKNGGPLCVTDGMISSLEKCQQFVVQKQAAGCVSTSAIRKWKGQ